MVSCYCACSTDIASTINKHGRPSVNSTLRCARVVQHRQVCVQRDDERPESIIDQVDNFDKFRL
jgi:hypothetical protein